MVATTAYAQKAWSVIGSLQVHGSGYVFANYALVSPRVYLRPTFGLAGIVGVRYGITQHLNLEGGIGPLSHGLTIASVADYPGGRRFEAVHVSTVRFTSPQVHLVLQYRTSPSSAGHAWVLELGNDVISRRYTVIGSFGARLSTNAGQPPAYISGTNQSSAKSLLRFGLRGSIGREWQMVSMHFVGLKLLGTLGLQELVRSHLTYSFTEDGITKTYDNTVHTRLGYVGVQTWYRFQL